MQLMRSAWHDMRTVLLGNPNVRILLIGNSMSAFAYNMLYPLLSLYAFYLGASVVQAGWVFSAYGLMMATGSFFSGFLSDRYGRRRLILIGWLLSALPPLLYLLARDWSTLLVYAGLWGLAVGLYSPNIQPLLTESSESKTLGTSFGYYFGIITLVAGLGPLLGGVLAGEGSYIAAFAVASGLSIFSALFALRLRETLRPSAASPGRFRSLLRFRAGATSLSITLILVFWVFYFTNGLGNQIFAPLFPLYLKERVKASTVEVGLVFTSISLPTALTVIAGGKIGDRFGRKRFAIISSLVFIPLMPLLAHVTTVLQVIVIVIALVLIGNVSFPALQAFFMESFPSSQRGRASGLMGTTNPLSLIIGPPIAGIVWSAFGAGAIMYASALTFVVAWLFLVVAAKVAKPLAL